MCILDRAAVSREPFPDHGWRPVEEQPHEARMIELAHDRRLQRTQAQAIAGCEGRRRRAMLGRRAEVALAEHNRREISHRLNVERASCCEAHFDRRAGRNVHSGEAGRQRRGIVGDHEIARAQIIHEGGPPCVNDLALRVHDEKLRLRRTLHRLAGGNHARAASAALPLGALAGTGAAIRSSSSSAASSGRFNVDGSASGTA